MNLASVTLTTSGQSLYDLVNAVAPNKVVVEAQLLIVQCPIANGGTAYFGDSADQIFELAAGDPFYYVPGQFEGGRINLKELYFKTGNAGDKLSVMWVEYGKTN